MAQPYDKPHLSYEEQLGLLRDRGLTCADRRRAIEVLRAAGYYRLSAYVYPFREALSAGETATSPTHLHRYEGLRKKAAAEDYMQHNLHKYGGDLPVWIAVEFLDFGAVVRLFRLLHREDQNVIARDLGIKHGRHLASALQQLNYARNLCAHHSRLWNRTLTLKIGTYPAQALPAALGHTADLTRREKVYLPLAFSAHLTRELDRTSEWPSRVRAVVLRFPRVSGCAPETAMGFPDDWAELPLWTSSVATSTVVTAS